MIERRQFLFISITGLLGGLVCKPNQSVADKRQFAPEYFNKFISYGPGTMHQAHKEMLDEMIASPVESLGGAISYFETLTFSELDDNHKKAASSYMAIYFYALFEKYPESKIFLNNSKNEWLKMSINQASKN